MPIFEAKPLGLRRFRRLQQAERLRKRHPLLAADEPREHRRRRAIDAGLAIDDHPIGSRQQLVDPPAGGGDEARGGGGRHAGAVLDGVRVVGARVVDWLVATVEDAAFTGKRGERRARPEEVCDVDFVGDVRENRARRVFAARSTAIVGQRVWHVEPLGS